MESEPPECMLISGLFHLKLLVYKLTKINELELAFNWDKMVEVRRI